MVTLSVVVSFFSLSVFGYCFCYYVVLVYAFFYCVLLFNEKQQVQVEVPSRENSIVSGVNGGLNYGAFNPITHESIPPFGKNVFLCMIFLLYFVDGIQKT